MMQNYILRELLERNALSPFECSVSSRSAQTLPNLKDSIKHEIAKTPHDILRSTVMCTALQMYSAVMAAM